MAQGAGDGLSRRERQIMEIVFAREQATALEVVAALPDPPTKTAVRTLLRILEEKGHLKHVQRGREFVYQPTQPRLRAARSAFQRVLKTFLKARSKRPWRRIWPRRPRSRRLRNWNGWRH
jgi:predicted transcriptional regulator